MKEQSHNKVLHLKKIGNNLLKQDKKIDLSNKNCGVNGGDIYFQKNNNDLDFKIQKENNQQRHQGHCQNKLKHKNKHLHQHQVVEPPSQNCHLRSLRVKQQLVPK